MYRGADSRRAARLPGLDGGGDPVWGGWRQVIEAVGLPVRRT
jgi:hypothetical protein